MSRIGELPIPLPKGVDVTVSEGEVQVKGGKGALQVPFDSASLGIKVEDGSMAVERKEESKKHRALHGLIRALVANAVEGVTQGFSKNLDVYGVGFRVDLQGRKLVMNIGYSHTVEYEPPQGIELSSENPVQGAQARIVVKGIDKQLVGQVAADIRSKRKPDPYKGKGIRYENEVIHWKAGKTASV